MFCAVWLFQAANAKGGADVNEEGIPTTKEGLDDALQQAAKMKVWAPLSGCSSTATVTILLFSLESPAPLCSSAPWSGRCSPSAWSDTPPPCPPPPPPRAPLHLPLFLLFYVGSPCHGQSAKLKADPRRREWEMAPVWMRCTCSEEGDLGDIRQKDFDARLAKATQWREQANELFREVCQRRCFAPSIARTPWGAKREKKNSWQGSDRQSAAIANL